jgi:hypothetical protein
MSWRLLAGSDLTGRTEAKHRAGIRAGEQSTIGRGQAQDSSLDRLTPDLPSGLAVMRSEFAGLPDH